MMSLHKFPAVIFPDDDIEERTYRWVDKCMKKFNIECRTLEESTCKDLLHQETKEPKKPQEVEYYVETGLLWSLSVFIRSTMFWERVHDFQLGVESYQQKVNLTAPTNTFPGIEKYRL
ncbi:hypothetical protein Tco_0933924 [Tanacetum coccineum]